MGWHPEDLGYKYAANLDLSLAELRSIKVKDSSAWICRLSLCHKRQKLKDGACRFRKGLVS
jgi:hypothetical protein